MKHIGEPSGKTRSTLEIFEKTKTDLDLYRLSSLTSKLNYIL